MNLETIKNEDGIITRWPKKKEEKRAVLEYLITKFEPGKKYSEFEVNMILKRWHSFGDHALLRRELFDAFLLDRTLDCKWYEVHAECTPDVGAASLSGETREPPQDNVASGTDSLATAAIPASEPSREIAERLLKQGVAKNPGPWREHSIAVAQAAEKIARAVNEKLDKERINPDSAYVYGLLHDIGRQEGYTYLAHVYDGYHFLSKLGYKNAARICLTHSFNLHTFDDYIGKIDISDEKVEELKSLLAAAEFDDYDRLIQLLDSTCAADGTKNLEARMSDVKARYGYYPEAKWNKNFELKEYFEKLAGRDFYDMI